MGQTQIAPRLLDIYKRLYACYGRQYWWPAQTPFEVMVGAVLTQSAAWTNVAKAIENLRCAGVLNPCALREIPLPELVRLVYPSGYYNMKAKKLKALVEWLSKYDDSLKSAFDKDRWELRKELLGVYGIGEETADSIILYAASKPVFVIDAYTRRIFGRLGIEPDDTGYGSWQKLFMDNLPEDVEMYKEYHALIVRLGKEACWKKPDCKKCCFKELCERRI